jgi:hypothetical protein
MLSKTAVWYIFLKIDIQPRFGQRHHSYLFYVGCKNAAAIKTSSYVFDHHFSYYACLYRR